MLNLMTYDKQLQDLKTNYELIRKIRDNEQMFTNLIKFLKQHNDSVEQRELAEMRQFEDMIHAEFHP